MGSKHFNGNEGHTQPVRHRHSTVSIEFAACAAPYPTLPHPTQEDLLPHNEQLHEQMCMHSSTCAAAKAPIKYTCVTTLKYTLYRAMHCKPSYLGVGCVQRVHISHQEQVVSLHQCGHLRKFEFEFEFECVFEYESNKTTSGETRQGFDHCCQEAVPPHKQSSTE